MGKTMRPFPECFRFDYHVRSRVGLRAGKKRWYGRHAVSLEQKHLLTIHTSSPR
jgi:hypothetical protein